MYHINYYIGVIIYCKNNPNMEDKDLMYIILGRGQICPYFMVSEKCMNTKNVFDYNCEYSSNDTWMPDAF